MKAFRYVVVLIIVLFVAVLFATRVDGQATQHCPDHQVEQNSKTEGPNDSSVLAEGVRFCVKAGPYATGILTADGVTSLGGYVERSGIRVGNDNVPGVSYYVVYPPAPTPSPSPEPTPEPTPGPSPSDEPTETECPIEDRSARGYCPGEPGHEEEIPPDEQPEPTVEPTEPVIEQPTDVSTGEPIVDEPVPTVTPRELPVTGTPLSLALLALALGLTGAAMVRYDTV